MTQSDPLSGLLLMDLEVIWKSDKNAAAVLIYRNNLQIPPVLLKRKNPAVDLNPAPRETSGVLPHKRSRPNLRRDPVDALPIFPL